MRDPRERILDMLDAIDRIRIKTAGGRALFDSDELVQTWAIHHLEIKGEAAARLGQEFHGAGNQRIHRLHSAEAILSCKAIRKR